MRTLAAIPIDPEIYAPYGSVVAARPTPPRSANHGRAEAWDALAILESHRDASARCSASLFRCLAHRDATLPIRWLERHPFSTQMFVPMSGARYLVVVALGQSAPDLDTLAAFVVEGARAITYAPGVWHHPMVALDADADFVNVLFADGSARDCDEVGYASPLVAIAIEPTLVG